MRDGGVEDSQSTNEDSLTSASDLFPFDSHCCEEGESCDDVVMYCEDLKLFYNF